MAWGGVPVAAADGAQLQRQPRGTIEGQGASCAAYVRMRDRSDRWAITVDCRLRRAALTRALSHRRRRATATRRKQRTRCTCCRKRSRCVAPCRSSAGQRVPQHALAAADPQARAALSALRSSAASWSWMPSAVLALRPPRWVMRQRLTLLRRQAGRCVQMTLGGGSPGWRRCPPEAQKRNEKELLLTAQSVLRSSERTGSR